FASQLALLASPGELRGEAKSEAQNAGAPVLLWCGDALAEKFLDARVAIHATQFEVFEIDDAFFSAVRAEADDARRRREERLKERQRKMPEETGARSQPADGGGSAPAPQGGESSRPESADLSTEDASAAAEGAEGALRSNDDDEIGEGEDEGGAATGEEAPSEDSGRQSASAESTSG